MLLIFRFTVVGKRGKRGSGLGKHGKRMLEDTAVIDVESASGSSQEPSEKKPRKYKYVGKWSTDPKLQCFSKYEGSNENLKDKAYCTVCTKMIEGTVSHLYRHLKTNYHITRAKSVSSVESVPSLFSKKSIPVREAERFRLMLLKFLCDHNIAFNAMDHLVEVLKRGAHDSQIIQNFRSGRKVSRDIVVGCIGSESLKELVDILKCSKYSLMLDESTDVSTLKQLAVVARVVNYEKAIVEDRFLQLIDVEDASADGLFNVLCTFMDTHGIPFKNMLGYAADNASVMMGNMGGLKAKLQTKVPNLFVLGCICHSLHLCSSAACQKLPRSVEDLCKDIHSYINHSPKRLVKFQEFQDFVRIDSHRILHPCQTRWLSLGPVVDRMVEQWPALILFFQSEALESNVQAAARILDGLRNPILKLYVYFLSYILPVINKMNKEFQSESVKIHVAYGNICAFYKTILSNYIKREVIMRAPHAFAICYNDPSDFMDECNWYFGSKVEMGMADKDVMKGLGSELSEFRVRCLNFYIELAGQIHKRLAGLNEVLPLLKACDPVVVREKSVKSVIPLLSKFPQLVQESEYDQYNDEWRHLSFQGELCNSDNPTEFWCSVRKMKCSDGTPIFPKISQFMLDLMVLPHSSAAVERIFSQVKLVKTDVRNRLNTQSVNGILLAKGSGGNNCYEWEPTQSMIRSAQNLFKSCE